MKKAGAILLCALFALFFNPFWEYAQCRDNTSGIQISLLTYSPGTKLYSVFGHSALRVKIAHAGTDDVYNYGTFDFDDPSFYFRFVRGKLQYSLSKVPFEAVQQQVQLENRSLIETPLNLSDQEKHTIVQLLRMNYLPENRKYLYDFFYNNCSSKIIDLIDESVPDSLEYNSLAIPKKSFRKLMNNYLKNRPWTNMGIDFLMGIPADHRAKGTDIAFLPDYLHLLIKNIRIAEKFGFKKVLAQSDIVRINNHPETEKPKIQPEFILWPLALILLISSVLGTYIPGVFRFLEKTLLVTFGILGSVIMILWLATDHYIFNFNTDLLWANPLLLPVVFLKDSMNQIKIKVYLTYLAALFVLPGIITTMVPEHNFSLTAFATMIAIILINKIHVFRQTDNDPFYPVQFKN
ncbi:MAG: DUF4105 domain-containing protein [Bacteroidales bacterium]|jgi:hypothetical protein